MTKERIEFIDFGKGFAITTIVLMHALMRFPLPPFWQKVNAFGGAGIHLFIFLSGFGLALSRYPSLGVFFLRRIRKILFPYYAWVTFLLLFNQFIPLYPDGLYAYFGHIFLYKAFDERIIGSWGGPLWFMSATIQFFLVYPLVIKVRNYTGWRVFLGMAGAVSLLWWLFILTMGQGHLGVLNCFFLQYLWEFCLGIVSADAYKKSGYKFWEQSTRVLIGVAIPALILYLFLTLRLGDIGNVFNDIPAFFGYSAVAILSYKCLNIVFATLRRFIVRLGMVSYPVYLVHSFVISLVAYLFAH